MPATQNQVSSDYSSAKSNEFDNIAKQHYRSVYRIALRLTGCPSHAEDLTQETFIRAYAGYGSYDKNRPILPWLARIAKNIHIDYLRGQKQPAPLSLNALAEQNESEAVGEMCIPDERFEPERMLMLAIMDERLERALRTLPKAYRFAVLLCHVDGLSYEEIAAKTECSVGTVRSRLFRGRQMLQDALRPEMKEFRNCRH